MKLTKIGAVIALAAALGAFSATAKISYSPSDIKIPAYDITTDGQNLNLQIVMDASQLPLHSNQEAVIVPTVKNGTQTSTFTPIYICGRNRMIYHERNNEIYPYMIRNGKDASNIVYSATVPFKKWMDKAEVTLDILWQSCANCATGKEVVRPLADIAIQPVEYRPELIFLPAEAEPVKIRNEKGTAFIDFVVNKTEILPDFRNNARELAKIKESIDKVKDDKDVKINVISIQGSASPEGPYDNNLRLAKGRTLALADYVKGLYEFPADVKFNTSWIAEDWAGLKAKVENMELENKDAILALIDNSSLTDDQKDKDIKKDFPETYSYLLKNVYPSLRHSDYEITYTVKQYYNVSEILQVMKTAPQKLSLSEFYLASQSMIAGSDAYNEVFETAVRMFPNDAIANFNAASAAIDNNDFKAAEKYLQKAPKDNKTMYLRGVMAAKQGNYKEAANIFSQLRGVPQAIEALHNVNAIIAGNDHGNLVVTDRR